MNGTEIAARNLAAKRLANESIPDLEVYSRQQARRAQMMALKSVIRADKKEALVNRAIDTKNRQLARLKAKNV